MSNPAHLADVELAHFQGQDGWVHEEAMIGLYCQVFDQGDPFNSAEAYRSRLQGGPAADGERVRAGYHGAAGYELVTATHRGELVGFVYGFPLPSKTRWWEGTTTASGEELPVEFAREDSTRSMAVIDGAVRQDHQGRGLFTAMHELLLSGHPQMRATLAVEPTNGSAHRLYERLGYREAGNVHAPGEPRFTLMVKPPQTSPASQPGHRAIARASTPGR